MAGHAVSMSAEAGEACHETNAAHTDAAAPGHAAGLHGPVHSDAHDDLHGQDSVDCCASGACADCALAAGVLGAYEEADPAFAPPIKAARAPDAPLGRPLTHDPPPPRA